MICWWAGFAHEALYHREGGGGSGIHFPPGQRPPDVHLGQYAEQGQDDADERASHDEVPSSSMHIIMHSQQGRECAFCKLDASQA